MKTFYTLFLSVILFTNCSSDKVIEQNDLISGTWELKFFSPGFGPEENFNNNDIVWTFNGNNELNVIINITLSNNSNIPIKNTGNYSYLLSGDTVVILDNTYRISFDAENNLILSQDVTSDGKFIKFRNLGI